MANERWKMIKLIKKSDFTVTELAKHIGIEQSRLSEFMYGKKPTLTLDQLGSLCRKLKCTPPDLFYKKDVMWMPSNKERQ